MSNSCEQTIPKVVNNQSRNNPDVDSHNGRQKTNKYVPNEYLTTANLANNTECIYDIIEETAFIDNIPKDGTCTGGSQHTGTTCQGDRVGKVALVLAIAALSVALMSFVMQISTGKSKDIATQIKTAVDTGIDAQMAVGDHSVSHYPVSKPAGIAFHAGKSVYVSSSDDTDVIIAWDRIYYDSTCGGFNGTHFTTIVRGLYVFFYSLIGEYVYGEFILYNPERILASSIFSQHAKSSGQVLLGLSPGDTVHIQLRRGTSSDATCYHDTCSFTGYMIQHL